MDIFNTAFNSLLAFLLGLTGDWFFAIVLLTLALKLIMFPLSVKQQKAAMFSQNFVEVRKSLGDRFKNKTAKVNENLARIMANYKVNPLLQLLPLITLLIQAPVFISLYYAILNVSTTAGSMIIPWVLSAGKPDDLHILPVLASLFQGLSGSTGQSKSFIMFILPVSIGLVFLWKAPVALSVYWGTNALLGFIERKILLMERFQRRFIKVVSAEEMLKSLG